MRERRKKRKVAYKGHRATQKAIFSPLNESTKVRDARLLVLSLFIDIKRCHSEHECLMAN